MLALNETNEYELFKNRYPINSSCHFVSLVERSKSAGRGVRANTRIQNLWRTGYRCGCRRNCWFDGAIQAGWGAEDVERLVATYASDAEWINAYADVLRGHDEMRAFFTEMFDHFDADIAVAESSKRARISLRYLGSDVAIVHRFTESNRTENRDGDGARRVHSTLVLEKQAEGWKIVHHMIMDVRR